MDTAEPPGPDVCAGVGDTTPAVPALPAPPPPPEASFVKGLLLVPDPPGLPWLGLVGGELPDPPALVAGNIAPVALAPPPEPPGKSWDNVRSTTAPYTESRLTRSVANERVGFPVVEHLIRLNILKFIYLESCFGDLQRMK